MNWGNQYGQQPGYGGMGQQGFGNNGLGMAGVGGQPLGPGQPGYDIITGGYGLQNLPIPNLTYKIVPIENMTKCLDSNGQQQQRGKLILYRYHGGANQRFRVIRDGQGYYCFVNVESGGTLEIPDHSNAAVGVQLCISQPNGTINEKWILREAPNGLDTTLNPLLTVLSWTSHPTPILMKILSSFITKTKEKIKCSLSYPSDLINHIIINFSMILFQMFKDDFYTIILELSL